MQTTAHARTQPNAVGVHGSTRPIGVGCEAATSTRRRPLGGGVSSPRAASSVDDVGTWIVILTTVIVAALIGLVLGWLLDSRWVMIASSIALAAGGGPLVAASLFIAEQGETEGLASPGPGSLVIAEPVESVHERELVDRVVADAHQLVDYWTASELAIADAGPRVRQQMAGCMRSLHLPHDLGAQASAHLRDLAVERERRQCMTGGER